MNVKGMAKKLTTKDVPVGVCFTCAHYCYMMCKFDHRLIDNLPRVGAYVAVELSSGEIFAFYGDEEVVLHPTAEVVL